MPTFVDCLHAHYQYYERMQYQAERLMFLTLHETLVSNLSDATPPA